MATRVLMRHPQTLSVRNGFEGFSWTCFFFGPFPALFRGDLLGFLAMGICAFLTSGLSGLVWMFLYNNWHYSRLVAKGYEPAGFHTSPTVHVNVAVENVFSPQRAYEDDVPVVTAETRVEGGRLAGSDRRITGFGRRSFASS